MAHEENRGWSRESTCNALSLQAERGNLDDGNPEFLSRLPRRRTPRNDSHLKHGPQHGGSQTLSLGGLDLGGSCTIQNS